MLGRANRVLAPYAARIATGFEETAMPRERDQARAVHTGNPVRPEVIEAATPYRAPQGEEPIEILVTGGSQGAAVFSEIIPPALAALPESLRGRLRVTQQCREDGLAEVRAVYEGPAYRRNWRPSSAIFRRAWRGRILWSAGPAPRRSRNLAATGRPAIMIPYPHAIDNHQRANAARLCDAGGGWLIPQEDATPESLSALIRSLLESPDKLQRAAECARRVGVTDAAERLADLVCEMIGDNAHGAAEPKSTAEGGHGMREMPLTIGTIHFVGIGGIGMSGIAEILHNLGYSVQGSDLSDNANVKRLREMGIAIEIGHREENIGDAQVVVISSAVNPDNPEVVAARAKLVPVVRRAEMLAELMRLKWAIAVGGTHGKTTTTSLISAMLDTAGYDPTVINGGIINAYGTNARLGAGEWMVVEADESDGTFVKLPATIAVVTNIDPEHMEFYGSFDKVKEAFRTFVENIPFYGFAALCMIIPRSRH